MADTKLADLTALTETSNDDLLYVVDDPAGTPADRKLALSNFFKRGTITTSSPVIDAAQTWNAGAVTFTGLKLNVTDTASASGSLLMDLQVGGNPRFQVAKGTAGHVLCEGGTLRWFGTTPGSGANATSSIVPNSTWLLTGGSTRSLAVSWADRVPNIQIPSSFSFGWAASSDPAGNGDTFLTRRDAASVRLGDADTSASATITVTIASPGVVTWTGHGLSTGTPVVFSTTGALPTGITAGTTYYVIPVAANTFQIATSFANALAGTAVNTSGSQSGTHTARRGALAQTFGVQDTLSTSSLENIDGADFVIRGSRSIGNKPGGSIIFQVAPAGSSGTAQNALATALTINSTGRATLGINSEIAVAKIYNSGGTFVARTDAGYFQTAQELAIGGVDVFLFRDATNTLALRNGPNAQRFNLYGTYTASDNFERLFAEYNSAGTAFRIGTEKGASGGTARALEFQTDGTTRLTIASTSGNVTTTGSVTTAAPAGGTAAAWKLGTVATVSPTSPNRTIEVDIGGTIYYISAKTTND